MVNFPLRGSAWYEVVHRTCHVLPWRSPWGSTAHSKRHFSLVSSVFDPLGFLPPFVLLAKEILQSLCRIKLTWDDEIPPECRSNRSKWCNDLPKLSSFSVTWSLLHESFGHVVSSQLHFSDASEVACGSVCCFRLVRRVKCTVRSCLPSLV